MRCSELDRDLNWPAPIRSGISQLPNSYTSLATSTERKFVTFSVLVVARMKMTIIWDVTLCSLVVTDLRFRGTYRPDDGGSKQITRD